MAKVNARNPDKHKLTEQNEEKVRLSLDGYVNRCYFSFHDETETCIELNEMAFPIKLEQTGLNRFRVTYGAQISASLTYSQACTELGASIMHALACDGRIENQTDAL